jgi:hypothetical protein
LKTGQTARVLVDGQSVLVKPEAALAQMQADLQQQATGSGIRTNSATAGPTTAGTAIDARATPRDGPVATRGGVVSPPAPQLRRFHASVTIDPLRLGRDASQIAEEVVQHLTRIVGAEVGITLEIQADLPEGASEKLVRDVTENCRTLRFDNYSFEEA